jgi:hypothetical protein
VPHSKAQGKFFRRAENFLATDETRMKIKAATRRGRIVSNN